MKTLEISVVYFGVLSETADYTSAHTQDSWPAINVIEGYVALKANREMQLHHLTPHNCVGVCSIS